MFAANRGFTDIVELLATASADLDLLPTDAERMPALIAAASKGHARTVAALLKLGARAEVVDGEGRTALMHASESGNLEVMAALLDGGADVNGGLPLGTPLVVAASSGKIAAVKLLLQHHAEVDKPFRIEELEGVTALMAAAIEGKEDVVRLLVQAGADLEARNSGGATALDLARTAGKEGVAAFLLAAAEGPGK
jgi:ankyrin repeat protein